MLSSEFTKMLCRMEFEYRRARFAEEDIASWDVTELPVLVAQPGAGKTRALLSYLGARDMRLETYSLYLRAGMHR